jgi:hypothetical protein
MPDDEAAGDDFSGLTGRLKRSAAHAYLLVAFIALIGTVTAIVVLVTAARSRASSDRDICSVRTAATRSGTGPVRTCCCPNWSRAS